MIGPFTFSEIFEFGKDVAELVQNGIAVFNFLSQLLP